MVITAEAAAAATVLLIVIGWTLGHLAAVAAAHRRWRALPRHRWAPQGTPIDLWAVLNDDEEVAS